MSRQSCLKLCRDRIHLTSRQRIPGHEVFHVATMGQGTVLQSGYARTIETLCRDSVALCCIATEKAMHARQTRLGAHDKAGAPRLGVHDKGIPSQQIFLCRDRLFTMAKKKKKKRPPGIGASHLVSLGKYIKKKSNIIKIIGNLHIFKYLI